jgi:hypothetical protein
LRTTTRLFVNDLNDRYLFASNMYLGAGASETRSMIYKKLPPRARLKVSGYAGATAAQNRADCEVAVLLVQE